jgi:hypothetical protein
MSLLFKSKKSKTIKRQTGGTIPFYTPFEVQMAKTPVASPASLLKLYGSDTSAVSAKSESKSAATKVDAYKPAGLPNEVNYALNDISQIDQAIEDGVSTMGSAFLTSPTGKEFVRQRGEKAAQYDAILKHNETKYNDAVKEVKEKDGGSQPIFSNGKFWAIDKNGDIKPVNPEEIDETEEIDGTQYKKYQALDYKTGFTNRAGGKDSSMLLGEGNSFTDILSNGRSPQYVMKKVNDVYNNIGSMTDDHKYISQVGTFTIDAKTVREVTTGKMTKNNIQGLKAALAEVNNNLSQADKDALEAQAWMTVTKFVTKDKNGTVISGEYRKPKTKKEALDTMNEGLLMPMLKRVDSTVETIEKDSDVSNPNKAAKEGGTGVDGGPVKEMGKLEGEIYSEALSGEKTGTYELFTPENLKTVDSKKKFVDEGFTNNNLLVRFPLNDAPIFTKTLKEIAAGVNKSRLDAKKEGDELNNPLMTIDEFTTQGYKNSKTNPIAVNIDKAMFPEGSSVKNIGKDPGDPNDYTWKEKLMIKNAPVQLAYLPVDNRTGTLWNPESAQVKEYDQRIKNRIKKSETDVLDVKDPNRLLVDLKKMSNEFYSKIKESGIVMKPFLKLEARIVDKDKEELKKTFKNYKKVLKNIDYDYHTFDWDQYEADIDILIPAPDNVALRDFDNIEDYKPQEEAMFNYGVNAQRTADKVTLSDGLISIGK